MIPCKAILVSLFFFGGSPISGQVTSTVQAAEKHGAEKSSFLERYYQIRDTYPKLAGVYGNFAACDWPIEEFMKRYYQIEAAYPKLDHAYGDYAASNYKLPEFIKRYYQMRDTYKANDKYY